MNNEGKLFVISFYEGKVQFEIKCPDHLKAFFNLLYTSMYLLKMIFLIAGSLLVHEYCAKNEIAKQ